MRHVWNPETLQISNPTLLGAAIRTLRQQADLTQVELAELAGIHTSYLSELERGNVTEQTDRIFRLLRRLGATLTIEAPT